MMSQEEIRSVLDLLSDREIWTEWQARRARKQGRRALKCGHPVYLEDCPVCKKSQYDRGRAMEAVAGRLNVRLEHMPDVYGAQLRAFKRQKQVSEFVTYLVIHLGATRADAELLMKWYGDGE